MSRGHAITIDLPRENPFGEQPARGNRSSGQTTGRSNQGNRPSAGRQAGGRGLTRAQDTDDAGSFDESYGGRQGNVVVLPDVNPFGQDDTPRNARSGGQASGRPSARGEPRARAGGNGNQGRGVTVLASDNPFGRTGNRNAPRIVEYQPTESEPEEDEEEEEEEEQTQDDEEEEHDYPPSPEPVRRANTARAEQPSRRISNQDRGHPNGGQRAANSRNRSRAADAQADDRLVIMIATPIRNHILPFVRTGLVASARSPPADVSTVPIHTITGIVTLITTMAIMTTTTTTTTDFAENVIA
ncbi:hypothetical protein BN14_09191 [Rhizoctonia solani AG-1 IB]|uniref:Uncharacterized protein n=1 Tax=Thanatephorus cucumeris (strain AG1-IB / isolate 7/3/14) TaxID=1108050 RepID=M5CFW5_THACB|nr:hypothetical protein BN14_09191 [Rhizoctonia solani AG-1 IB]